MNRNTTTKFTDQGRGEDLFNADNGYDDPSPSTTSPSMGTGECSTAPSPRGSEDEPSLGELLRKKRNERRLSLQDCARELHLPVRLLQKLEKDDYEGIDYSVYLSGYLRKYADHVGLDPSCVEARLESLQSRQPELVAALQLSKWQRAFNRYSSAATYAVLTAVIVVPLVWLGLNGVLKRDIAKLAPLNAAPVNARSTELTVTPDTSVPKGSANKPAEVADPGIQVQKPLMASIAPFSAMESSKPAITPIAPQPTAGTHVKIALQQASWVQITDAAGKRLEYALLPAGTDKSYVSDQALDVRIGNADGAQVVVDGKPVVLGKYRHANVAHFDIADNGEVQPHKG